MLEETGSVILPIKYPTIGTYCHQAIVHTILSAYEEALPWLHGNYISIYSIKDMLQDPWASGLLDFYCDFYGNLHFRELSSCPWFLMCRFPREIVKKKWDNPLVFTIERLSSQEYVFLTLDRKYYRHTDHSSFHPVLIYGYDLENSLLFAADNNPNGKYALHTIAFDAFLKSSDNILEIEDAWGAPEGICTVKVRKSDDVEQYRFHVSKVIKDIRDYLMPFESDDLVYCYGVDCYQALEKYYVYIVEEKIKYVDIRAISTLVDHKSLMVGRFRYMFHEGYLSDPSIIDRYNEKVANKTQRLRNILLKYNVNNNLSLVSRCIDLLNMIRIEEIALLNEALDKIIIKKTVPDNIYTALRERLKRG